MKYINDKINIKNIIVISLIISLIASSCCISQTKDKIKGISIEKLTLVTDNAGEGIGYFEEYDEQIYEIEDYGNWEPDESFELIFLLAIYVNISYNDGDEQYLFYDNQPDEITFELTIDDKSISKTVSTPKNNMVSFLQLRIDLERPKMLTDNVKKAQQLYPDWEREFVYFKFVISVGECGDHEGYLLSKSDDGVRIEWNEYWVFYSYAWEH